MFQTPVPFSIAVFSLQADVDFANRKRPVVLSVLPWSPPSGTSDINHGAAFRL